jgi:hypothetical protein
MKIEGLFIDKRTNKRYTIQVFQVVKPITSRGEMHTQRQKYG